MFYGIFALLKIPVLYVLAQIGATWNVVVLYNAVALLVFCGFQLVWVKRKLKALVSLEQGLEVEREMYDDS